MLTSNPFHLDFTDVFQGPDAVHIQQVGQRELRRAPGLTKRHAEVKKKEKVLLEKAGFKAHL
jgi:acyl-CoA dehydrogenase